MSSIAIKIERSDEATVVQLSGDITENTDFGGLLSQPSAALVFDLSGIRHINSCGVREWINFVTELKRAGKSLELERCSVPIVNQLNMISNFRGGARVRSIYTPYYCAECDREHPQLMDVSAGVAPAVPEVACPDCQAAMEFDDLPEAYFAFLT